MAAPHISEVATMAIESRRRRLADNVSDNTALLNRLKRRRNMEPITGGRTIYEELEWDENQTYKRFSGYEVLDINPSDVFSAAEYDLRQVAVAITISGLEELHNAGRERMMPLLARRISNAERTMTNGLSADLYSDGSADGGKQIDGLQMVIPTAPDSGKYAGIDRSAYEFWRPVVSKVARTNSNANSGVTQVTVKKLMMGVYLQLCRNMDKVDLIPTDNSYYEAYWSALQDQQRFTNSEMAKMGFANLKFINADVILDGGVGGSAPGGNMFFLNTNYIHWRPHRDRNMTPGEDRIATNQDAMVKLIMWAGNLTTSNSMLQGRMFDVDA